jgi:hypothetical protein
MFLFENTWACSGDCLRILVARALRREAGNVGEARGRHHHRIPLGLIMLSRGWITQEQLQYALEMKKHDDPRRIGEWLVSEFGVEAQHVTRALGIQWNCPVFTDSEFDAARMALLVARELVRSYEFLPLRLAADRILYLAFAGDINRSIAYSMEKMLGLRVENGQLSDNLYTKMRGELFDVEFAGEQVHKMPNLSFMAEHIATEMERKQAANSKLVRMHNHYWLRMWFHSKFASGTEKQLPDHATGVRDYIYQIDLSS